MPDQVRNPTRSDCTATCPLCGADLVFVDHECICKSAGCGWSCQGCEEPDDV